MTSIVRPARATPLLVWLAALLALILAAPRMATAADYDRDVDVSTFYDELEDDGDWVEHPRHGYVWTPSVDDDWRPYTRGRWENTEEHGWYWDSEEPFGWAVYHYGRWGYDDDIGWYWVPGRKWGPAWVDWRHSDDEIGWRPLAPDEDWEPSGNLRIRAAYYDEPSYAPRWIFVAPRYFAEPSIHIHLFPRTQSVVYLQRTRRVTTYRVVNQRIFNTGLNISFVQRYAPRPIVARRITVSETRFVRPGSSTTVINVYRPKALRTTTTTTVRLTKPRTVVNRTVVVQKKQTIRRQPVSGAVRDLKQENRDLRQELRQEKREDAVQQRQENRERRQRQEAREQNQQRKAGPGPNGPNPNRQAGPGPNGPKPNRQAGPGPNGPKPNRQAGPGPNGPKPNRQAGPGQGGPGGPGGPGPGGQGGPKKKPQDENPNKKKKYQQNQN